MELSSERPIWLIAILIAVLHAAMAVTAVNTKSPTFDEPQHLTAGYSYWVTNDFRLDPENGNLPARWAALPLLLSNTKFISLNGRAWQRAEEGRTAHQFLYEIGNDPDRMIVDARMMMSIFGIGLCLLIFRCSREFFGGIGGLIAETVAAFDPNFLAHGALVTSDVPAAFFFTAVVWSSWRLLQEISPARVTIGALSLAGLFLTKFSAPIVLPIIAAMAILGTFSRVPIQLHLGKVRTALTQKFQKVCAIAASLVLLATTIVFAIWLSFSFRYAAWTDTSSNHEGTAWHWSYLLDTNGAFEKTIGFARAHHLLPEAYLYGLAYVHTHENDRPAFLDNQWSIVGFRSFFPRAFLYKTPLPFLVLLVFALFTVAVQREKWKQQLLFNPFLVFAIVYAAFAVTSQLNIGHRHLLPIYPALFICCGALVSLMQKNRSAVLAATVTVLLLREIGESVAIRPNYLAYFNQIAGGPSRGCTHLVDSSLDWGQDLPAVKEWIDSRQSIANGKPLYLAYFGTADPRWYEIDARLILPENKLSHTDDLALNGGLYFVSATTLQSVYTRELGPWCAPYEQRYQNELAEICRRRKNGIAQISNESATISAKNMREFERLRFERLCAYLRHQKPIAQIGYSIFVFDLNDAEINAALYGPPVELASNACVNGL